MLDVKDPANAVLVQRLGTVLGRLPESVSTEGSFMTVLSGTSRRSFLSISSAATGSIALAGAFSAFLGRTSAGESRPDIGYGELRPVRDQSTGLPLLKLPEGFTYRSFGWTGDPLTSGQKTPAAHDGMAVIDVDKEGLLTLCRNHELSGNTPTFANSQLTYDQQAPGGCVNLVFDGHRGEWKSAVPTLSGTVKNCAGGPTPWNTWLTCEEDVSGPGTIDDGTRLDYGREHGWIFEVGIDGGNPQPIRDMGRFVHEALAVDPDTGYVYETEDRSQAGLYRFRPNQPGDLHQGGRLEMLRVNGAPDLRKNVDPDREYECSWVPIHDPHRGHAPGTTNEQGVFHQGKSLGGTTFARLEGCWYGNGQIYFDATSGGDAQCGQIWTFDPAQSKLKLLFESPSSEVLDSPDNLAVSPRGGVILCEDGDFIPQRMHGLTNDGILFPFAANNVILKGQRNGLEGDFRGSEWAGATFSPDGKWLFANVQNPGFTVAITGPWSDRGL